jgi:glutaredoxin
MPARAGCFSILSIIAAVARRQANRGEDESMPWFRGWAARSDGRAHVVLFTRQGCRLCEDAWEILESLRPRYAFTLEAVDVDGDASLAATHGERVPVIAVNGVIRLWGRISAALLERALRATGRG